MEMNEPTVEGDAVRHLYAHIPFCPRKCPYCAFVTHVGSLKLVEPYVGALLTEMDRLAAPRRRGPLQTVYLGGGTPSMLAPTQIDRIVQGAATRFGIDARAEITMEAHPDTVDERKLRGFRSAGITRLSFGGESLDDGDLRRLGREHTAARVIDAVTMARSAGIRSVNVDLMYGLPDQSEASWQRTITRLLQSRPDHISLYPLSIEPQTVFARRAGRHELPLPDDEAVAVMYADACAHLTVEGYEHYEVANWALPGHRSRHNLAYWQNREFYAVGAGAHGYLRPYRTENIPRTKRYIDMVQEGSTPVHRLERIDRQTEASETVMLRLRLLQDGLDLREMAECFGPSIREELEREAAPLIEQALLHRRGDRLLLDEAAVPIGNEIWQRFMSVALPKG